MKAQKLIEESETELIFELIYDANKSMMVGSQLGEAIIGMSTCIAIAGRTAHLDFETVYVFPIAEGSIITRFAFTKREKRELYVQTVSGTLAMLIGTSIIGSLTLIGTYGLAALKSPSGDILARTDPKILELCTNTEFRRAIPKIAMPINEWNQKVTIKVNNDSYNINCENQYKFITEDKELILPELRNGETVNLTGTLTRMNMRNNDLGFEYHGKTLSISPIDPDKNVATEYHQFTPLPQVNVMGIVERDNDFVVPRLKVIKISDPQDKQMKIFEEIATLNK